MTRKRKVFRTTVVLRVEGEDRRRDFDALIMRVTDGFVEFVQRDLKVRGFNAAQVVEYTMEATGETIILDADDEVSE
jgi:hypothetical protein